MEHEIPPQTKEAAKYRVGGVRFFNARPLLYGLGDQAEIQLAEAPPARLADDLNLGKFHAALVPSIDYQRTGQTWTIVPEIAIGSAGAVLTVQIFSQNPLDQIDTLACDLDSHTSIALAQIIFHQRFNKKINIIPLTDDPHNHDAVLLIGDKVLPHLDQWPQQMDLGRQWQQLTGLPFVYAFWALPENQPVDQLMPILNQAARNGLANLDDIIHSFAADHGFTPDLAHQYLTQNLTFDFSPAHHQGLMRFYEIACELNLIPHLRPLNLYTKQEPTMIL